MKNQHILVALANLKRKDCLHKVFYFGSFNRIFDETKGACKKIKGVSNCGTAGCLAGELPGLDKNWYFDTAGDLQLKSFECACDFDRLIHYFDLSRREIHHIFFPNNQSFKIDPECKVLDYDATFEEVQNNLRRFLKIKGIDYANSQTSN